MLVNVGASVFNESIVDAGIFANAASTGANTVNWPPSRVSTRFTPGFSRPDTAAVNVVSSGLFDAATATGSCAIPATDPGPLGTCEAYAAHPEPTRLVGGSAAAVAAVFMDTPITAAAIRAAVPIVFIVFF